MNFSYNSGVVIECNQFKLILDASRKVDNSLTFISHAHSDHVKKHSDVLSTPANFDFFNFTPQKKVSLDYKQKISFDDNTLKLHNACHILGSAQIEFQNSQNAVYTGDFRLNESVFFPGCEPVECDTLIIESTYGNPNYIFPDYHKIVSNMQNWVEKNSNVNIIFGAYSLGKAQEVVKILNEINVTPIVHPKSAENCEIYSKHGLKLDFISSESEEAKEIIKDRFVAVFPPHLLKKHLHQTLNFQNNRETFLSNVTGWNLNGFCLSDHADFNQLLEYVERANPKRVFTVHGFEKEFAQSIQKKLHIPAQPLKDAQMMLNVF